MTQTGTRFNYLLAPVVLLLLLIVGCGGKSGGENTSGTKEACKQGCYRGHGVSFNYPPKWRKTQDVTAPISDLWFVTLALEKPSDYVAVFGSGPSELDFPAANLAAGKAELRDQLEGFGFHVLPGSEKLTIDGRPGLRFRTKRGKTIETTTIITFKGKTQYRIDCFHVKRAAEMERGCAQIVRTFKVAD